MPKKFSHSTRQKPRKQQQYGLDLCSLALGFLLAGARISDLCSLALGSLLAGARISARWRSDLCSLALGFLLAGARIPFSLAIFFDVLEYFSCTSKITSRNTNSTAIKVIAAFFFEQSSTWWC